LVLEFVRIIVGGGRSVEHRTGRVNQICRIEYGIALPEACDRILPKDPSEESTNILGELDLANFSSVEGAVLADSKAGVPGSNLTLPQ
jgi:hypothetical protein